MLVKSWSLRPLGGFGIRPIIPAAPRVGVDGFPAECTPGPSHNERTGTRRPGCRDVLPEPSVGTFTVESNAPDRLGRRGAGLSPNPREYRPGASPQCAGRGHLRAALGNSPHGAGPLGTGPTRLGRQSPALGAATPSVRRPSATPGGRPTTAPNRHVTVITQSRGSALPVGAAPQSVIGLHPARRSARTRTQRRSMSFGADGDHLMPC